MLKRRRFKQTDTLEQRLVEEANRLREEAKLLPPGAVRDATIRKARQADAAIHNISPLPACNYPRERRDVPRVALHPYIKGKRNGSRTR